MRNSAIKKKKDFRTKLFVNLDSGGFLIKIKIIIVAQNIANIAQPVIKA